MATKTTTQRVVITKPTEAVRYLREYMRSADFSTTPFYTIGTSKARWASVAQMVTWFRTNRNLDIDAGWFGRSLNEAENQGLASTTGMIRNENGRNILIYRNFRVA
jgi:hypothetical protein